MIRPQSRRGASDRDQLLWVKRRFRALSELAGEVDYIPLIPLTRTFCVGDVAEDGRLDGDGDTFHFQTIMTNPATNHR